MKKLSVCAAFLLIQFAGVNAAHAQMCEGQVHGLSGRYNPATGSGFLAVRAGPNSSATQLGELFNGEMAEIFDRKGRWYKVASENKPGLEGWVSAKFLINSCNY